MRYDSELEDQTLPLPGACRFRWGAEAVPGAKRQISDGCEFTAEVERCERIRPTQP